MSGSVVPGLVTTASGRDAELWRQTIDGFSVSGSQERELVQVQEWRVDPTTGQVLERSFSQRYEGIGEVSWEAKLIEADQIQVPDDFLTTDGFKPRLDLDEPPDLSESQTPTLPPSAEFSAERPRPAAASPPATVVFTDQSTGASIASWLWQFGDGSTSTERNPSHIYPARGAYNVTLTVTDAIGRSDMTVLVVNVE